MISAMRLSRVGVNRVRCLSTSPKLEIARNILALRNVVAVSEDAQLILDQDSHFIRRRTMLLYRAPRRSTWRTSLLSWSGWGTTPRLLSPRRRASRPTPRPGRTRASRTSSTRRATEPICGLSPFAECKSCCPFNSTAYSLTPTHTGLPTSSSGSSSHSASLAPRERTPSTSPCSRDATASSTMVTTRNTMGNTKTASIIRRHASLRMTSNAIRDRITHGPSSSLGSVLGCRIL